MRPIKTMICITVFLCCAIQYLYAQEAKTRLPELDVLMGSWNVTAENRLGAAGPWDTSKGTAVIRKSTGGSLIEEEYTGTLNNKSFFTKSIIAYNHFSNAFQRTFLDSEHGVLIDYEGTKKADSVLFDKRWTYPNGASVKLRVVYTIISPDEFMIENMRMPDSSSEWDITGKMRYTRQK